MNREHLKILLKKEIHWSSLKNGGSTSSAHFCDILSTILPLSNNGSLVSGKKNWETVPRGQSAPSVVTIIIDCDTFKVSNSFKCCLLTNSLERQKKSVWVDWFPEVALFKAAGLEFRNYALIPRARKKKITIKKVGKNVMTWIFGNNPNNTLHSLPTGRYQCLYNQFWSKSKKIAFHKCTCEMDFCTSAHHTYLCLEFLYAPLTVEHDPSKF